MKLPLVLAAACGLSLAAAPGIAQNGPPPSVFERLQPGQTRTVELTMKVRGVGLEIATGTFRATLSRDSYSAEASYRTSGIGAALRRNSGQSTVRGAVSNGVLRPRSFVNQETSGKRRRIAMNFSGGDVSVTANPMWSNMGTPPANAGHKARAVDPVTGLMELALVTSRDSGRPCGGTVRIFDGKRVYDIRTQFVRMAPVNTPAFRGEAAYCRGSYIEVAGFNPPEDGRARPPIPLEIWLADVGGNGVSVPVRMLGRRGVVTGTLTAERVSVR